jgi:hypothetical protein
MVGVLFVAVLLIGACQSGSYPGLPEDDEAGGVSGSEGAREEHKRVTKGGVGQVSSNREDDMADAPQEIAGAFLTCAKSQGAESADLSVFGCRVENDRGVIGIGRYDAFWSLADRKSNRDIDSANDTIKVMPLGDVWQVEFRVPKLEEKNLKARVSFKFEGGRIGSISKPFDDKTFFLRPSQRKIYHIGDTSLLGRLLGSCRIQASRAAPVGPKLTLNVVVEAVKTPISIDIGGLCGVNFDTNTVSLKNPKGEVLKKQNIERGAGALRVDTPILDPGIYTLEIEAGSGLFGRPDHFVAQDILVTYPVSEAKVRIENP